MYTTVSLIGKVKLYMSIRLRSSFSAKDQITKYVPIYTRPDPMFLHVQVTLFLSTMHTWTLLVVFVAGCLLVAYVEGRSSFCYDLYNIIYLKSNIEDVLNER